MIEKPETKAVTLLLAEDDEDDVMLFKEALSSVLEQYSLVHACNGLECITQIKKQCCHPDVIFLDLNMPLKNGKECLKSIVGDDLVQDVPVVMYSTSHNIKDIDACYKMGAKYYMVKPNSFPRLVQLLQQVFQKLAGNPSNVAVKEDFVIGLDGNERNDGKVFSRKY